MAKTTIKPDVRGIQSLALRLLAWGLLIITTLSTLSAAGLIFTNLFYYESMGGTGSGHPLFIDLLLVPIISAGVVLTSGVGLIILLRSSNWQMGWLLLALGAAHALGALGEIYTDVAFKIQPGASLPFRWPLAWFQHWAVIIIWGLYLVVLPLLFPTGRPLSSLWRVVLQLALIYLALGTLVRAFGEGPLEGVLVEMDVINPYGFIPAGELGWLEGRMGFTIWIVLLFSFAVLAITSLVLRYRRSRGHVRQQFKWIAYALAIWAAGLWMELIGFIFDLPLLGDIGWTVWHTAILGFPVAIGFAILRYRLYDIDRLINRTLVYGALTGTLALLYFSSVVLLQQIFPAESQIAIVLSTLAIAALFSPLRRRIQNAIDMRFYRRKYDAQQTLAAFGVKMRDEVELDRISESLLAVVDDTMQPAHASLWFREAE